MLTNMLMHEFLKQINNLIKSKYITKNFWDNLKNYKSSNIKATNILNHALVNFLLTHFPFLLPV